MNAKEARERSLSITEGSSRKQYDKIQIEIEKAVRLGKFETYYYEFLLPAVDQKLREEGYKVQEFSSRGETTVTISW